jgi:hypothetical protein
MEQKFGVSGTTTDGIFFTEEALPRAAIRRRLSVEISRKNANLGEVKRKMATEARALGANAVINFRYGQRAHKWWDSLMLKWDTESLHGEGDAASL